MINDKQSSLLFPIYSIRDTISMESKTAQMENLSHKSYNTFALVGQYGGWPVIDLAHLATPTLAYLDEITHSQHATTVAFYDTYFFS